jgi:hypothetical protein
MNKKYLLTNPETGTHRDPYVSTFSSKRKGETFPFNSYSTTLDRTLLLAFHSLPPLASEVPCLVAHGDETSATSM